MRNKNEYKRTQKKQATKEIINNLYNLDSEIFPNFSLNCCELSYGIQEIKEGDILLETNCRDENNKTILIKLKMVFERG